MGRLATSKEQIAIGRIQRSQLARGVDILLHRLQLIETSKLGSYAFGQDDWLIVDSTNEDANFDVQEVFKTMELKIGQLVAYFRPQSDRAGVGWIGAIRLNETLIPMDAIEMVGPRMLRFRRQPMQRRRRRKKSNRIPARWSRVVGAMGEDTFRRFRRIPVAVVGAGRLGSLFAESCIRMGLRSLLVVDPDQLETHNQDATFGNYERDLQTDKVRAVCQHLHRIRSDTLIQGINTTLWHRDVIDRLRGFRMIVSCVDNREARNQIAKLARDLLLVHLDIGTLVTKGDSVSTGTVEDREFSADVRLLLPHSCIHCIGGTGNHEPIELPRTDVSFAESIDDWGSDGRVGSLLSLNHFAVGAGLQLWIDLLSGRLRSSFWQRIRWESGQGLRSEGSGVVGGTDCPFCRKT